MNYNNLPPICNHRIVKAVKNILRMSQTQIKSAVKNILRLRLQF